MFSKSPHPAPPPSIHPNQEYLAKVTLTPTYPRPAFVLPDLTSQHGNTREVASCLYDCLCGAGFTPEATAVAGGGNPMLNFLTDSLIFQTRYDEHPNLLSRFVRIVDLDSANDPDALSSPVKNLPLFSKLDEFSSANSNLVSFYQQHRPDFSALNNFSRSVIYYVPPGAGSIFKWLLKQNQQDKFIDFFHLDVFGQTALRDSRHPQRFLVLHDLMRLLDPDNTKLVFTGLDVFGRSCFQTAQSLLKIVGGSSVPNSRFIHFAGRLLGLCAFYAPPKFQADVLAHDFIRAYAQLRELPTDGVKSLQAMTERSLMALELPPSPPALEASAKFRL